MSKNTNWAHTWWPPIGDHMEARPTITEFLLARIAEDEAAAQPFPGAADQRALRECAAKRAIVESCTAVDDWQDEYAVGLRDDTLQSLAAAYSDHSDHQQEWSL